MIAIILGAGRGASLKELTEDKPTSLIELGGKTLLRWQCEALEAAKARRICVVRGYRSEQLTPEAAGLPPNTFETVENTDWLHGSLLSGLRCVAPWIDMALAEDEDGIIVSHADALYPANHILALANAVEPVAITYDTRWQTLWMQRFGDPLMNAETFVHQDGRLLEVGFRPEDPDDIQGQYMGLIRFSPKGWTYAKKHLNQLGSACDHTDMTTFIQRLVDDDVLVQAVPVVGHWVEVDSRDDYYTYKRAIERDGWSHDWRIISPNG